MIWLVMISNKQIKAKAFWKFQVMANKPVLWLIVGRSYLL